MKTSPLLLKWVSYPLASYEATGTGDATNGPCSVKAVAAVTWSLDGDHTASLELTSVESESATYKFSVKVIAVFSFDLDLAKKTYGRNSGLDLPPIIAVNVVRVLYAGAREQIAMMTARAPLGSATLESVLFEPQDIDIDSYQPPDKILANIFGLDQAELADVARRISELPSATEEKTKPASKTQTTRPKRRTKQPSA